jgi:NitT/TauT family transport system substrate-binding protein
MIPFIRQTALVTAVLAVIFQLQNSASAQTSMKLVLDWIFQGQHAPYFLANETGIFKDNGLSVQVDRGFGSGDTISKVAAGAYPVGIADLGSVITFNSRNSGNKIIAIFQLLDLAPLSIISLTETKIGNPGDLVGKKIAAPAGDSSRVMFPVFAKVNNLDPNAVEWIDVTPQLRASLLALKKVDAISAEMHNIINLGELGIPESAVSVMKYSDFGLKLYGLAFITTPHYAATHKQELMALLRSIVQAWKATIRDPKIALAYLKKRQPLIDEKIEMRRFEILLKETIATDTVVKNGISVIDPERLRFTAEVITKSIGAPMIDTTTLFDGAFLPPVADLKLPGVRQ